MHIPILTYSHIAGREVGRPHECSYVRLLAESRDRQADNVHCSNLQKHGVQSLLLARGIEAGGHRHCPGPRAVDGLR